MFLLIALLMILAAVVWRRWILVQVSVVLLVPAWFEGALVFAFESVHAGLYMCLWACCLLGVMLLLILLMVTNRFLTWVGWLLVSSFPCGIVVVQANDWWVKDRFEKIENRVAWSLYEPFSESNLLVSAEAPAELVFTSEEIPRISCAFALYPIGAAAVQAQCPRQRFSSTSKIVRPAASPQAYKGLVLSEPHSTAILALAPSTNQLAMAEKRSFRYEMTPIARDAFVFFVPVTNPIESLTSDQVRGIYSGRITSWRELGVDLDDRLLAFQRNPDSGSQTALERLMGEVPLMPPIKEDRLLGMGGIITVAADYRSYPGALGFSFRYYLQELVKEKKVKILRIDGVEPTLENIRNGSYPFVETAYVVTGTPRSENERRLVSFLTSPVGREMIQKIGYVVP